MANIIAIVGRPNVGKSTLFNRLLGKRKAIVDDLPGITRDRIYGTTEWNGKQFTIIDTGGFVPTSDNIFEQAIREQAQIAIDEADVVLFMVDAETDLTPLDKEIADILRKANKPIFLVVNKVDSEKREIDATSFYKLGFGTPFTISALLGRNIGDFLDAITKSFQPRDSIDDRQDKLKIAIVGKPNVGKSSLVNVLVGKPRSIVTDIPGTTRDSIDTIIRYHKEEIILIDTAGLKRKSKIKENVEFYSAIRSLRSIEQCNVAVLMIDISSGMDKQDLRILNQIVDRRRGVLIAANKWDLIEKNSQTAYGYERTLRTMLREHDHIPLIFISALKGTRVFKLLDLAKQIYSEQQKRIATNTLNKILLKEIQSFPPSSKSGKEIKINFITQIKVDPPTFNIFMNNPTILDESYKRFLEGRIRFHFGFAGVPIVLYFKKKN